MTAHFNPSVDRTTPRGYKRASISTSSTSMSSSFQFEFDTVNNMTTCQSSIIPWSFNGTSTNNMTLLVTNEDVPQSPPLTTRSRGDLDRRAIFLTHNTPPAVFNMRRKQDISPVASNFGESISPTVQSFQWLSVDVSQGWYIAYAVFNKQPQVEDFTSNAFFVANGSNVACLSSQSSSTSSTGSSTLSTTPISTTPTSTTLTSMTPTSGSPTDSQFPSPGAPHKPFGAIGGGIAGLLLLLIGSTFLFVSYRRHRRTKLERIIRNSHIDLTMLEPYTNIRGSKQGDSRVARLIRGVYSSSEFSMLRM